MIVLLVQLPILVREDENVYGPVILVNIVVVDDNVVRRLSGPSETSLGISSSIVSMIFTLPMAELPARLLVPLAIALSLKSS